MKTTQIIIIALFFIIGLSGGYFLGENSRKNEKDIHAGMTSETEMTAHMESMKKMAEMMKAGGTMMQSMGTMYKDDKAIMTGKDLEMMANKYLPDTSSTTGTTNSPHSMMNME
ncbi:MAG: hypothetical protein WAV09_04540 [Minisyncoccia bacterium]